MPRALITAANCAALGAINGTGWLASDSSLSTSTNWNVLLLEIRRAGTDFEHRHRIKGDMDCAVEDTQVGFARDALPAIRFRPEIRDERNLLRLPPFQPRLRCNEPANRRKYPSTRCLASPSVARLRGREWEGAGSVVRIPLGTQPLGGHPPRLTAVVTTPEDAQAPCRPRLISQTSAEKRRP